MTPDEPEPASDDTAAPDDDTSDGDDTAEAAADTPEGPGASAPRRRRRRRRRRGADAADPERVQAVSAQPAPARNPEARGDSRTPPRPAPPHARSGRTDRDERSRDERNRDGGRNGRNGSDRGRSEVHDARARGNQPPPQRPDPPEPSEPSRRPSESNPSIDRASLVSSTFDTPSSRLDPRRTLTPTDDIDLESSSTPAIPWGKDDDGPPAEVVLAADLPPEAPDDDADPLTHPLLELPSESIGEDIASVAGVRFVAGGRVQWCDAGDADYRAGERVVVEADRGTRLAWIAVPPARKSLRDRNLRRVIRRAGEQDLRGERDGDTDRAHALRVAKDKAAALRLPLKVFRVELFGQLGRGPRLNVYYTSDERLDLRDFIREVSSATAGRVELRQLGVRDEAKAVGGIGSCGLTLCCTTWLPDFVPVSIKMAKDQGLVLSPTKVSGQCGRLKCCLVYEQASYAELRKGLPKLGKRVVGARGEGRVVEVDVLRQRVRVSYGPGDTEVVPAAEVKPLFPSGNQPAPTRERPDADTADADAADIADELADAADAPTAFDGELPDDEPDPDDDPSPAS